MFGRLAQRYLPDLDQSLRQVASMISPEGGFDLLVRYPMGWIDSHGFPYDGQSGKRIRPLLLLASVEAVGGSWQEAIPAAAGVELLHNFSLVHDDIQDDSETRHGRPTVWKVWGRANAINAGDALFTLAFCALEMLSETNIKSEIRYQVWQAFNRACLELTRGQHLDMRFETAATVSTDEYLSMIQGKSAALIAAATHIGALIGSEDLKMAQHFYDFGLNLGIAFQIRDDILGIWGDPEVTGKSAASDILSRKKSLPVVFGLSKNEPLQSIYARESFGEADIGEVVRLLDDNRAREFAQDMEERYYKAAMDALKKADPQGEAAAWVKELAEALYQRAS